MERQAKGGNGFIKAAKGFMGTYFCLVAIIVLCVILTICSPYFFNYDNFKNILIQSAAVSIVCIGQFMCITKGGLDLSLGQVLCFSSCLMAVLMKNLGVNPYLSILAGLASGVVMGGFSGFMISYVGLPSFCPGPERADNPEVWYNRSTQKEAAKWESRTNTAEKRRSRR